MALTDKLTYIADAIRAKGGTSELLTLDGMVEAINAIETGGGGGGPYFDVTLLTTNEAPEDVSAIRIDRQTEWSDYDFIIFRPNTIIFSANDWLCASYNDAKKQKYSPKAEILGESFLFGISDIDGAGNFDTKFRGMFKLWTSWDTPASGAVEYIYFQPYTSTTLIKSGSKIDVLGVNFA